MEGMQSILGIVFVMIMGERMEARALPQGREPSSFSNSA